MDFLISCTDPSPPFGLFPLFVIFFKWDPSLRNILSLQQILCQKPLPHPQNLCLLSSRVKTDGSSWQSPTFNTDILYPGPPEDGCELWEEVRKARAAGGYPWTHLQHNQEEEVWINPLKLPSDISR